MNRDSQRLRLALVVLLLISFTLITLDYRSSKSGGAFSGPRHVASTVFGPIQRGFSSVVSPIGTFFSDVVHAGRDGKKVRSLQAQIDKLQSELRGNADVTRDRGELAGLIALSGDNQYTIVPARAVALGDLSGFDSAATLNVGSRDGIKLDMTVISAKGLVGRVVAVSPLSCTVALIIDPNLNVGSRLQSDAHVGITSGHGASSDLTFSPTDPSVRPKVGDVIETFGTVTYAANVPIGVVTAVGPTAGKTTVTAQVKPYVDFTALNVVGVVIPKERTATAQSTAPTPTVTATVTKTVTATPTPTGTSAGTPTPTPQTTATR